jgi:drug/metabolite transporter (DMT)-like permease
MNFLFWMIGALASFCILAIGARELSGALSISQTLCIRSAIGLLVLTPILLLNRSKIAHSKKSLKLHVFRNTFHYAAQFGWFFGIAALPLAEVFALEFTVPLWTLFIAALFLGEKITKTKVIALLLGLLGVVVIVKPGFAIIDRASLVVLVSAIFFAFSHTATKSLSKTESPLLILFYMCAVQFPIGLVLSYSTWMAANNEQWFWLVVIGLTALSAHYCLAKTMQFAEVTTVVTLDFLRLPLIAFVGVLIYGESLELSLFVGGFLMLIGNLVSIKGLKKEG